MNQQTVDILPHTTWPRFSSFLTFCCYFTCGKACEKSRQNVINSENIGQVVVGTVQ